VQVVIEGAETLLRITSKGVTSVRQIETPVATPGLRSV
jgi:hypothetical protein